MRLISRYNLINLKLVSWFVSSSELCKSEYFWLSHVEILVWLVYELAL